MPLGISLSGGPNTGFDVGGFYGYKPTPELFLRYKFIVVSPFYFALCIQVGAGGDLFPAVFHPLMALGSNYQ